MKVKILRSTVVDGKRVKKGATVTTDKSQGRLLVNLRKAEEIKPKAKAEDGK